MMAYVNFLNLVLLARENSKETAEMDFAYQKKP